MKRPHGENCAESFRIYKAGIQRARPNLPSRNQKAILAAILSAARPILVGLADSVLTFGDFSRFHIAKRSRRESNPHLRFRKPSFYPLNYGNNDICDFRFATADCKQRTSVVCTEIASVLSHSGSYTTIQRLILRQNAICRESFDRAIATAFT
jgi:hypothetical protein